MAEQGRQQFVDGCPFCDSASRYDLPFDDVFDIDDNLDVLIKPDLKPLIPGHLLALTTDHLTSFAQLEPDRLSQIDQRLKLYEDALTPQFGDYFRVEHGSDNLKTRGSGACIDHAHIHMIPADEDAGTRVQALLPWEQLDCYADLAEYRNRPYIYLGRAAVHNVVTDPGLHGQWIRRQVADVRGLPEWDWVVADARKELYLTSEWLRKAVTDISKVNK